MPLALYMETLLKLSDEHIDELVNQLKEKGQVRCDLPGKGKINIEKSLPFLLLWRYRPPEEDPGTARLLLSESSYLIIGTENFEGYQKLIFSLAEAISARHKSYLLLELWTGEAQSHTFKIKAPADRIPATIKRLTKELTELDAFYQQVDLEHEVMDTDERQQQGEKPLLSIEKLKEAGALLMGIEIPPVYRSAQGDFYPVFFRSFHEQFMQALQKALFAFIRVQTICGVANYSALGRASIGENAERVDQELCEIEQQFNLLWLVSPSNIKQIKECFVSSKYKKVLNYHYRLLPLDPDAIKRKLYNLPIENIEDPGLAFLFREKREELDRQITMLNERGTRDFFYNSIRLYKGVSPELYEHAKSILRNVKEVDEEKEKKMVDAHFFVEETQKELKRLKKRDPSFKSEVHLRDDVNVIMVSHGQLLVPADYRMPEDEVNALIQHEIGTHAITYHNGSKQPLKQLAYGLANYDAMQEGLAVMAEYLAGGLSANRLRILAARVVAGYVLIEGANFQKMFNVLHQEYGISSARAFNVTSRMFQGGGFLKDIIYLRGLVQLKDYLENGGELKALLLGKMADKHVPIMQSFKDRNIVKEPQLLPSYLNDPSTTKRINKIKEGISLSQMVSV